MNDISIAFVSYQLSKKPMNGVSVYNAAIISKLRYLGVKVYEIWPNRGLTEKWPFYNISSFQQVTSLCKQQKIKIIHSTMADGFILSFVKNIPYVLTVHGVYADEIDKKGALVDALTRKRFDRFIGYNLLIEAEKVSASNAEIVVVPSEYSKNSLIEQYKISTKKIVVIPHGVNIEEFNALITCIDSSFRHKTKILFVGRLTNRKGLIHLIRATESLSKSYQIDVRIVGDGPEKKNLEIYCIKRDIKFVKFLGHLPRKEVIREFLNCDIFCLPSLHEAFGIVLLEAMAAKRPIVATNVGGIPEVVENGEMGILVPPKDEKALEWAIEKLINDIDLRIKMGERGYEKSLSYTWEKSAQRLKQIYESLFLEKQLM